MQLGTRWYWPEVGRFIQQDPAGDGVNWYAYVDDNPVTGIDPEGLWSVGGEAYSGFGGGFTLGWDRCNGLFLKSKVGVGIGWGLSFDPSEQSPGRAAGVPGHGSSYGLFTNAQVQLGILGWTGNSSVGVANDAKGNGRTVGPQCQLPGILPTWNWPPTKAKKLGWSVSAGAEGALF